MRETTPIPCSDVRIAIVVDNHGCGGLAGEHGFAAWLEVAGHKILFDTGQGQALLPNAALLGCDLTLVDSLVLSHGHYDHGGALAPVLHSAPACRVFCHAGVLVPRYSVPPGEPPRTISLAAPALEALRALPPDRVRRVDGPCRILPGVGLSAPIPRLHPREDTGGPFFLDPDGKDPDPLADDAALWIDTDRGLLIVTGCCHAGVINTVEHIRSVSGVERVLGIIGGLHLVNAGVERLTATCSALRSWNPEFIVPCHCTGDQAMTFLGSALGPMVIPGYAGFTFTGGQRLQKPDGSRLRVD